MNLSLLVLDLLHLELTLFPRGTSHTEFGLLVSDSLHSGFLLFLHSHSQSDFAILILNFGIWGLFQFHKASPVWNQLFLPWTSYTLTCR